MALFLRCVSLCSGYLPDSATASLPCRSPATRWLHPVGKASAGPRSSWTAPRSCPPVIDLGQPSRGAAQILVCRSSEAYYLRRRFGASLKPVLYSYLSFWFHQIPGTHNPPSPHWCLQPPVRGRSCTRDDTTSVSYPLFQAAQTPPAQHHSCNWAGNGRRRRSSAFPWGHYPSADRKHAPEGLRWRTWAWVFRGWKLLVPGDVDIPSDPRSAPAQKPSDHCSFWQQGCS